MVSVNGLWIYDYFLTLGDEVQCPCIFRPGYQVLTVTQIVYAWSGRKSWGAIASTSSKARRTLTVARQYSYYSLQ